MTSCRASLTLGKATPTVRVDFGEGTVIKEGTSELHSKKPSERDRLGLEFGRYALWLASSVNELGLDPIPPACRGTGNPQLFEQLADDAEMSEGSRVLDLGSGLGGPAVWLTGERGCNVTGIEIMEESARGAAMLFPEGVWIVADSSHLPFSDQSFDAGWALGSIETMENKVEALREVRRVLVPGARFSIYSLVPTSSDALDTPVADRFEPAETMLAVMERAGLSVVDAGAAPALAVSPASWLAELDVVRRDIERRHGEKASYRRCSAEIHKMSKLFRLRLLEPWRFVLVKE